MRMETIPVLFISTPQFLTEAEHTGEAQYVLSESMTLNPQPCLGVRAGKADPRQRIWAEWICWVLCKHTPEGWSA